MDSNVTTPHIFSAAAEPTIIPHVSRYTAHIDIPVAPQAMSCLEQMNCDTDPSCVIHSALGHMAICLLGQEMC